MAPLRSHLPRALLGLLALAGLLLTVLTLVPPGSGSLGSRADAAIPSPGPGQAVLQMYVGDERTSATTIAPLPGVRFGLFRQNPSASISNNDGYTHETDWVTTCTSDAQGDCSFVVPIGNGAGEVPQNTQLYAAAISGPTGYYANPYWQTAPLTGGEKISLRHVFVTPPLVAGQTYRAGSDWVSDPGIRDPNGTINNYTQRIASGGVTPLSRVNPELPPQCGINVALIVDLSSSVAQANAIGPLKSAMNSFVDALRGTPSQAALFTFGTDSPANGYPGSNTGLYPVSTTRDATVFKNLYSGWQNPPTNYTNWDRGLAAAAADNSANPDAPNHFDVAVFLTDGNPTVYGPDPLTASGQLKDRNSGYTRFRELGNGLASANLLKSQGTRILAVGVGEGVSGAGAEYNLRTVSGQHAYTGGNILDADYFQTSDYAAAGNALRDVVLSSCAPSISVVKQIVPFQNPDGSPGTIDHAYTPSEPWRFDSSTTTAGATISPPTATTSPQTGATNFDVTLPGTDPGTFQIEEQQQPPYTLYRTNADGTAAGGQNASCVDKSSGTDVQVPVENVGDTGFRIPVGLQGVVSCVVYNQAPDFTQASVVVHKRWQVVTANGTQNFAQGAQPADLHADLSLDGPDGAPASPQAWDEARGGYDVDTDSPVTVEESFSSDLPGCTLQRATIEDGPPGDTDPGSGDVLTAGSTTRPLTGGENEWTITNRVVCHSYLTLRKDVASGDGDPSWWTLHARGETNNLLPGPQGVSGSPEATRQEVSPERLYELAEQANGDVPHEYLHYLQNDERTDPLQYPQSTGSWACDVDGAGTPPDPSVSTEGGVYVPLGMSLVCTAVNQTAFLTVVKHVSGGDAAPEDFTFRVEPIPPVVPGGHGHDIAGAADPGTTVTVRPTQHYRLTEIGNRPGYQLTDLHCVSGARDLDPDDFFIEPGGSARCTATNSLSSWTVEKTSDPPSGTRVRPGDTITYTVTATHLEGPPTRDVVITDDLSDVLDDATLEAGTIAASVGAVRREGDALHWTIPRLEGTQRLTYRVRVDDDAWETTLRNVLTEHTTGTTTPDDPGDDGDEPVSCVGAANASTTAVARVVPACDVTVNTTVSKPPAGPSSPSTPPTQATASLPDTGGPAASWLVGGAVLILLGGALLGVARLSRRR